MSPRQPIEELLARSSLGTPAAESLCARTSEEEAGRILTRAAAAAVEDHSASAPSPNHGPISSLEALDLMVAVLRRYAELVSVLFSRLDQIIKGSAMPYKLKELIRHLTKPTLQYSDLVSEALFDRSGLLTRHRLLIACMRNSTKPIAGTCGTFADGLINHGLGLARQAVGLQSGLASVIPDTATDQGNSSPRVALDHVLAISDALQRYGGWLAVFARQLASGASSTPSSAPPGMIQSASVRECCIGAEHEDLERLAACSDLMPALLWERRLWLLLQCRLPLSDAASGFFAASAIDDLGQYLSARQKLLPVVPTEAHIRSLRARRTWLNRIAEAECGFDDKLRAHQSALVDHVLGRPAPEPRESRRPRA
jgi:hypothetical protein